MDENYFAPLPVAVYGCVLLMAAIPYFVLQIAIVRTHGTDSKLAQALGSDVKGKLSIAMYVLAIACENWLPWLALAIYVGVALTWFVPDRRIERVLRR